ncbi:hypothetical protein F4678DRAFT_412361 [Xylaria arbuscula]|nr:hypothetical protein F4678DRAFT_412361 [Xylaria arbuscula]
MSRRSKRYRQDVNCDGCGCGQPECVSCYPPETDDILPPFGHSIFSHTSGVSGYYSAPRYQWRPSLPATLPPPPVQPSGPSFADMVSQLDNSTVRSILTELATVAPSAQAAVTSSYQRQLRRARERILDFSKYSVEVWHILNTSEYTEGSGSKQFEASFEARSDVVECIEAIGKETKNESSYGTKLSAVETLRKIAKTILLTGDTLGREVRMEFQHESCLADIMVRIVRSMTPDEQRRAGANTDAKGSLASKVRWVCDEAESYCLEGFYGLHDVLALIGAPGSNNEPESRERGDIGVR